MGIRFRLDPIRRRDKEVPMPRFEDSDSQQRVVHRITPDDENDPRFKWYSNETVKTLDVVVQEVYLRYGTKTVGGQRNGRGTRKLVW
jgi:hypothetical protein